MSTRAIQFLKQQGIPFDVIKYEHKEKGAAFAAHAIDFPLEKTVKTLVVKIGPKSHALALMPGDKQLNLKKIAAACRVKKAAMADTATAERLTGYLVGGISPFGTKKQLPVIVEKGLLELDQITLNAGQRGTMLKMTPRDVLRATAGKSAQIS